MREDTGRPILIPEFSLSNFQRYVIVRGELAELEDILRTLNEDNNKRLSGIRRDLRKLLAGLEEFDWEENVTGSDIDPEDYALTNDNELDEEED